MVTCEQGWRALTYTIRDMYRGTPLWLKVAATLFILLSWPFMVKDAFWPLAKTPHTGPVAGMQIVACCIIMAVIYTVVIMLFIV